MFDNISDEPVAQKVADKLAVNIQQYKNSPFDSNTALPQGSRYTINLDRDGRFLKPHRARSVKRLSRGPRNVRSPRLEG